MEKSTYQIKFLFQNTSHFEENGMADLCYFRRKLKRGEAYMFKKKSLISKWKMSIFISQYHIFYDGRTINNLKIFMT